VKKKRILIVTLAVTVMLIGGITAGTALNIQQPASAQIRIEDIGGGSPTFNLIDNDADTGAGSEAGDIVGSDYVIDFAPLIFGRNQEWWVGSSDDPIFTLENNYAKGLLISLKGAGAGPSVNGLGFALVMLGGKPWWLAHPFVWATPWNTLICMGWDWICPGKSYDYHLHYRPLLGIAQPEQSFTLPLKIPARGNDHSLEL